jgi:hypothetical protein
LFEYKEIDENYPKDLIKRLAAQAPVEENLGKDDEMQYSCNEQDDGISLKEFIESKITSGPGDSDVFNRNNDGDQVEQATKPSFDYEEIESCCDSTKRTIAPTGLTNMMKRNFTIRNDDELKQTVQTVTCM